MQVVRLSPAAERDLDAILDYIAQDSYPRAKAFADELYAACMALAVLPRAHQQGPDLGPGLRQKIHENYVIFFRIGPDEIRVERILHGARDLPALMRPIGENEGESG